MLKAVEKNDRAFADFCDRDVFGTRIKTYYNCYSTDYDFVKFWAQYDEDGEITAAISRVDGDITLCNSETDIDELKMFFNMGGFRTIQCSEGTAKCLSETIQWGYVVQFVNAVECRGIETKKFFEPKEIYDIIKPENLTGVGDYMPWLSDTVFRLNRNAAEGAVAQLDGENAGCAMVLFRTDKASLLGAVATRPQFRGRGVARSLVTGLARKEKQSGRRVELLCRSGTIIEFYKSIGFEVTGKWGLIQNETEFL